MKNLPITVVIPVKDRFHELCEAIDSINNQKLLPSQLIIIDDASENPLDINSLPKCCFDVTVIRNNINIGGAKSINIGVKESKNTIVCILDSDDVLYNDYTSDLYDAWIKYGIESTAIVAVGFNWCDDNLRPYKSQVLFDSVTREDLLRKGNVVGGSSVLSVNKSIFIEFGGYPDIKGSFDYGMMLNLSRHSPIRVVPKILVGYRSPSTSVINTVTKSPKKQIKSLFCILNSLDRNDKKIARNNIAELIAGHLAKGGYRHMSLKIIKWLLINEKFLSANLLKILTTNILGPKKYFSVLRVFALFRVKVKNYAKN